MVHYFWCSGAEMHCFWCGLSEETRSFQLKTGNWGLLMRYKGRLPRRLYISALVSSGWRKLSPPIA
jgi:hypothetical protein